MSQYSGRSAPLAYQTGQFNPAAHQDSSFNRLQADHQHQNIDQTRMDEAEQEYDRLSPASSLLTSPVPPPHKESHGRNWPQEPDYRDSNRTSFSVTTPGADNFGDQAAGGIAGIALNVASANARESGIEAMRNIQSKPSPKKLGSYHQKG